MAHARKSKIQKPYNRARVALPVVRPVASYVSKLIRTTHRTIDELQVPGRRRAAAMLLQVSSGPLLRIVAFNLREAMPKLCTFGKVGKKEEAPGKCVYMCRLSRHNHRLNLPDPRTRRVRCLMPGMSIQRSRSPFRKFHRSCSQFAISYFGDVWSISFTL